jgi:hypothetical protein
MRHSFQYCTRDRINLHMARLLGMDHLTAPFCVSLSCAAPTWLCREAGADESLVSLRLVPADQPDMTGSILSTKRLRTGRREHNTSHGVNRSALLRLDIHSMRLSTLFPTEASGVHYDEAVFLNNRWAGLTYDTPRWKERSGYQLRFLRAFVARNR